MDDDALDALLEQDLGPALQRTGDASWQTTSGLPHEIRRLEQGGMELVRVSAGAVIGASPSLELLTYVNELNVHRAWSRRFVVDGKVLVAAELPVGSLQPGQCERLVSTVLCQARLDADDLAAYGGRPVTAPPPHLAADLEAVVADWPTVLRASRTATQAELTVWIDQTAGVDCWLDRESDAAVLTVAVGTTGLDCQYPFRLGELLENARELQEAYDDDED